jgi:hypothetical protein
MTLVEEHIERTEAFSNVALYMKAKLPIYRWLGAKAIPVIITLHEAPFNLYKRVPVVPVLKLANFLNELPANLDTLKIIRIKVNKDEIQS